MVAAARPVEALPELSRVEVLMFGHVENERGLHHVAHRFALQLKAQAHAVVGVEHADY